MRNSTLNLIFQAGYAVLHLLAIAMLARSLDKSDFGRYYTLFALVLVVQLALELGVGTALTRRLSHRPHAHANTTAEAAGIFALIATLSFAVLAATGWMLDAVEGSHQFINFALAGLACAALQVARFCAGVFRAFEEFRQENAARILQGASFVLLFFVATALHFSSLTMAMAIFAFSHLIAAAYMLVAYRQRWRIFTGRLGMAQVRDWIRESVPVGIGDAVRGLNWQLDTVYLGWARPAAEVAIFSIAYRPLGPLNWIPRAVTAATFTSFAKQAQAEPAALTRSFSVTVRVLWITSLVPAVLLFVFAEPLVRILAGPGYLDAVVPLRLLIWIACLSFISYPLGAVFAAIERPQLYAQLSTLSLVIKLLLLVVLVPWWGYYGACVASFASELFFALAGLRICAQRGLFAPEWRKAASATAAAFAMTAALWPVRHAGIVWLVLAGAIATLLFLGVCVMLGALQRAELANAARSLRRRRRPVQA